MKPFIRYRLNQLIEERKRLIISYISNLSDDDVLSEQDEIIKENMYEMHHFETIIIKDEQKESRLLRKAIIKEYNPMYNRSSLYAKQSEYFEIEAVEVTMFFEFIGDKILFESQSSTISLSEYPEIEIEGNFIKIKSSAAITLMEKPENSNHLFNRILKDLETIRTFINLCNEEVMIFNRSIKVLVNTELNKRKEKSNKLSIISKLLQIPIENKNPKLIETIKIERSIKPLEDKRNKEKQYSISEDDYLGILSLIKHQGSTFERTPKTYLKLSEEELRDVILSSLNAVYKGKFTGETFRKFGKSDIAFEYENRAAFIAECKFWSGYQVFVEALDQLQRYITWRDTKLCLIIFSLNKDFFNVIRNVKLKINSVDNYYSMREIDQNEFEIVLNSLENQGQLIRIRLYIFDLST